MEPNLTSAMVFVLRRMGRGSLLICHQGNSYRLHEPRMMELNDMVNWGTVLALCKHNLIVAKPKGAVIYYRLTAAGRKIAKTL